MTDKQQRFCEEYVILENLNPCDFNLKPYGYYVYFLINPITNKIFYIGKGKGNRVNSHLTNHRNGKHFNIANHTQISEILRNGHKPVSVIFENNLSEKDAYSLEYGLIKALINTGLTNKSKGVVSEKNDSILWANGILKDVIPFNRWMAIKRRTKYEISVYWLWIKEVVRISIEGFESKITITNIFKCQD